MSASQQQQQIDSWIRKAVGTPAKILIRTKHIEKDRIWRDISEADVRKVLSNGRVHSVRSSDQTVFWRGADANDRELELQCSLMNVNGVDTLVVKDADKVRIGTAYQPDVEDEKLKEEWLKRNPAYEKAPGGKVQRRIIVTKT